jgi:uncharacterized membrane protein (UPF0127 family)
MDYIKISDKKFPVLLAISSDEQQRGLMYREPPLPNMCFPSRIPQIRRFWMKSVKADLDVIFCLKNKISSIWRGEAGSTAMIGNDDPCDLVIEMPYGTCKSSGITVGSEINLELSKEAEMKFLMLKTGLIF